MAKITGAIVTYNSSQTTEKACKSVLENTQKYDISLYVFDNASTDDTAEKLGKISGVIFKKQNMNLGFGAAHNKILEEDIGDYHFVINPDIVVNDDVISRMADFMEENPDIAMCCPEIRNSDGSIQHIPKLRPTFKRLFFGRLSRFGGIFKKIRDEYTMSQNPPKGIMDIDFCTGCFFVIKGEVFKKLSGFDERYFMYMEDVDLTLSAKKFGRTVINTDFTVTHEWKRDSAKSLKYLFIHLKSSFAFLKKWRGKNL